MAVKKNTDKEKVAVKPEAAAAEEPIIGAVVEVEKEINKKGVDEEGEVIAVEMTADEREKERQKRKLESWTPKTETGRMVRAGKIKNVDELLEKNIKILEPEILDSLLDLKFDLFAIGQSKGKFGGGKRRAWKQTQRKTEEGNVPKFSAMAVVGDGKGHVGIGKGCSKETLPAREKAIRKAKLEVIKIARGCGSFDCSCNETHSIPFAVEGKSGSVRIKFFPAPQGTGLVTGNECKKLMKVAGIKDIYTRTFGYARTTENLVKACIDALKKTTTMIK